MANSLYWRIGLGWERMVAGFWNRLCKGGVLRVVVELLLCCLLSFSCYRVILYIGVKWYLVWFWCRELRLWLFMFWRKKRGIMCLVRFVMVEHIFTRLMRGKGIKGYRILRLMCCVWWDRYYWWYQRKSRIIIELRFWFCCSGGIRRFIIWKD
jgi:hypothetical protein